MISIRAFSEKDLDAVLELSRASNSTDRTKATWLGNNMTAVLAFDENRLIGFIPFEKRKIIISKKETLNVLWVSGTYVEPEYRGKGVGSRMDRDIKKYYFPEFKAVLVCREDESSPAYRWYSQLEYKPLASIVSFRKEVAGRHGAVPEYAIWKTKEEIQAAGGKLFKCFETNIGQRGGFQERSPWFWADKLEKHYYKSFYAYYILAIQSGNEVVSYAMLGQTRMKDDVLRFDILEVMGKEDNAAKKDLYTAIMDFADQLKMREVRVQLVEREEDVQWLQSFGFTERWRTNIMGKLINSSNDFPDIHWHYFQADYI